jgi:hypothetical protein
MPQPRPKPRTFHYTRLPARPGRYLVLWTGWRTLRPVFMDFRDGAWVRLEAMRLHYPGQDRRSGPSYPGEFHWFPDSPLNAVEAPAGPDPVP